MYLSQPIKRAPVIIHKKISLDLLKNSNLQKKRKYLEETIQESIPLCEDSVPKYQILTELSNNREENVLVEPNHFIKKKKYVRPSIPAYGASQRMMADIESSLVEATIDCGYDDPSASISSKLPNDIILIIFHNISDSNDLLAAASVSRRWLILASESNLWKSLYEFYFGPEYELSSTHRSWKFNFQERRKELLSQSGSIRSYTRKKKPHNTAISSISHNNELTLPVCHKWSPTQKNRVNTTTIQSLPAKHNVQEDARLLAFLEEKKHFFDSFGSVSLLTTPCKKRKP